MDNNLNIDSFIEIPSPKHGSAADRGSADAYYQRAFDPHCYEGDTYKSDRIEKEDMSENELIDYKEAYESQTDVKDWG